MYFIKFHEMNKFNLIIIIIISIIIENYTEWINNKFVFKTELIGKSKFFPNILWST